ncbi:hypothetical protein [Defluviitalea phaphyphila]|uniref:hypothetical protein n=1 Tax=Defluviitalea phaphyphila TaxID=1473580 RepID=UPI0007301026|nr:hypothetical protein [Defluviitalea phaphyphila]
MRRKKFFTDSRIVFFIRWWVAGAVYFFIGWGTNLANQASIIDFVFFLGLGLGAVNAYLVNPIVAKTFNVPFSKNYNETTVAQKVRLRIGEIIKAIIIVIIMVYIYTAINKFLIYLFSAPKNRIFFPGEPISFGLIYVSLWYLFEKFKSIIKKNKKN